MKFTRFAAITAALGVVVAGGVVASSASADVVSNSYVMVGSDTLQDAANALANGTTITGTNVRVLAAGETIGSFNAFPNTGTGSMIQTKPGGPFFERPAGSGNGRNALIASIKGTKWKNVEIGGQVDIARSSSGPGSNANADGKLAYIPFGRDAVAYIYTGGTAAWANLNASQLNQIYAGTLKEIDGVAITPRLPQTGSGTRDFFLAAIGNPTLPSGFDSGNTTAENDATVLGANQIIPFSVASWTAQSTGAAPSTLTNAAVSLGSAVSGVVAVTGTGSATVPNSAYYANTTFGRDTYLIVERARITSGDGKYDPTLAALVNPSNLAGLTNFTSIASGSPRKVKEKFGFLAPSQTAPIFAYASI